MYGATYWLVIGFVWNRQAEVYKYPVILFPFLTGKTKNCFLKNRKPEIFIPKTDL